VLGEVPTALLDEIIADLTERLEVDPEDVNVQRAQAVIWNDGSLGCPKPGQFYTQALVDGYQVVLSVADRVYDYRASQRGYFFLCEPALPLTPP